MRDPASFLDVESPAVAEALTEMTRIVLDGGGALHPGLTMLERDGAMTVLCTDSADAAPDQPLFDVPREMLIPVDGAQWADSTEALVISTPPPRLTALQLDLLDLHMALYNACGKLPWIVASHPKLGLGEAPEVVAALRALRPGFAEAAAEAGTGAGAEAGEMGEPPTAVAVFLGTRVFGLRPLEPADSGAAATPENRPNSATPANQRVLMTLIDLLNHHPRGAPFRVDARATTTAVARPTGTDECFARYGYRRDSLDLALNYGYVDTATDFVHCPPLSVEVPGVGIVRVSGQPTHKAPPSPLDPPHIAVDPAGVLTLSHIVFRPPAAGRWELPVVMALQARALHSGASTGAAREAAVAGVGLITERVAELLCALGASARKAAPTNPAAEVLAGVAAHQLGVVQAALPRA